MKTRAWKAASILMTAFLAIVIRPSADEKIVLPVHDESNPGQATFSANYDRVWNILTQVLSGYQFELKVKDQAAGKIETGIVVFSRNPQFSKLSAGVKSYATPPRIFLHKWLDARIRVRVLVTRASADSTQVVVEPEIQGFATSVFDDSTVSGDWRDCRSNGKFEFELLNDVATRLKNKPNEPLEAETPPAQVPKSTSPAPAHKEAENLTNLILQSVPEGAEIFLNDRLVGMTPSRLSVPPGEYKVLFRKSGYKDFSRAISILKRSDLTISSELDPLAPTQQPETRR